MNEDTKAEIKPSERGELRWRLTDAIVAAIRSVVGEMPQPLVVFDPFRDDAGALTGSIMMAEPARWIPERTSVSAAPSERVVNVVGPDGTKIGETYDCGEPGCCSHYCAACKDTGCSECSAPDVNDDHAAAEVDRAKHPSEPRALTEAQVVSGCVNFIMAGLGNIVNGQRKPADWMAYVSGECDAVLAGAWKQHVDDPAEAERMVKEEQEQRTNEPKISQLARELDDALLEMSPPETGGITPWYDPPWTPRAVAARDALRVAIGRPALVEEPA